MLELTRAKYIMNSFQHLAMVECTMVEQHYAKIRRAYNCLAKRLYNSKKKFKLNLQKQ